MGDRRIGGVRMQDWVGLVMVAVGVALLLWFSWAADAVVKGVAVVAIGAVIVAGGYLLVRRAEADR
ncbi:MAG: hypothetical protein ACLFMX_00305 [Halobacteriales archaeon]